MSTAETKIKIHLRRVCRRLGWDCYSAPALGVPGWPDKMVMLGGGVIWFVEVKASQTKQKKDHVENQLEVLDRLHEKGHPTAMVADNDGVDNAIDTMIDWCNGKCGRPRIRQIEKLRY